MLEKHFQLKNNLDDILEYVIVVNEGVERHFIT